MLLHLPGQEEKGVAAEERHTSHDLKRIQSYLRSGVISGPLHGGVEHSVHYRDFSVIEDKTCRPERHNHASGAKILR